VPAKIAVANAAGLLAGALLDAALGDPRRWHPVAGYGRAAAALERRMYAPTAAAGARYVAVAVGVPTAAAALAGAATRRRPVARAALVAATTWAVLGSTSLRREGAAMATALDDGDLAAARDRLPHLCGRDPSALEPPELARATVESVAENTSDAAVGALFWGAVAGLPGLVGYRAVNTLDVAAAPLVDGSPWRALWTWARDGRRHPSPNSGQCEAAMAGALGVRLGGRNVYAGRVEQRPVLGRRGRAPGAGDIHRAVRLSGLVSAAATALAVTATLMRRSRPGGGRTSPPAAHDRGEP
jgi:adenosylcobinamide-phosphate synthase